MNFKVPAHAALLLLVFVASCDFTPYRYPFEGRLVRPDGSPAAGTVVSVTAAHSPGDRGEGAYPEGSQATTAADGRFHGEFHGDQTYWGILKMFGLPQGAPPMVGVVLWTTRPAWWDPNQSSWEVVGFVPLDEGRQRRLLQGGRHVTLPTAVLPDPATRPATVRESSRSSVE